MKRLEREFLQRTGRGVQAEWLAEDSIFTTDGVCFRSRDLPDREGEFPPREDSAVSVQRVQVFLLGAMTGVSQPVDAALSQVEYTR